MPIHSEEEKTSPNSRYWYLVAFSLCHIARFNPPSMQLQLRSLLCTSLRDQFIWPKYSPDVARTPPEYRPPFHTQFHWCTVHILYDWPLSHHLSWQTSGIIAQSAQNLCINTNSLPSLAATWFYSEESILNDQSFPLKTLARFLMEHIGQSMQKYYSFEGSRLFLSFWVYIDQQWLHLFDTTWFQQGTSKDINSSVIQS
jgi:hypothetical protein